MRAAMGALRARCRTRSSGLTAAASIGATLALGILLVGRWDDVEAGVTGVPVALVVVAVALQVVALVSRSEAWHLSVRASGGTVARRRLYRASSMAFVGNLLNSQLGALARIAALRRSAPHQSPRVPTLIAAELPILTVEATLAALTSFTLIGPLGLSWWVPLLCLAAVLTVSAGLRRLGVRRMRWLGRGLSVMRTVRGRRRLVAFVLVAVGAQIGRNWLMLHAVGVDASVFDAIAVLIAVVTLGQLPLGLSVGTAASVLILGPQGVAAAAAAGLLLTATGTLGGLGFATWGAVDSAPGRRFVSAAVRGLASPARSTRRPRGVAWTALAALPLQRRRSVERAYFGGLSHLQITRMLGVATA